MSRLTFGSVFLFCLVTTSFCNAQNSNQNETWQNHSYKVLRITDGDTATMTDGNIKFKVRFAGMDAPEKAQDFGKVASNHLSELILNQNVQIKPVASGLDRYGRVLGQVIFKGQDVSVSMIQDGYATYYRPKCRDYEADKKFYDYDPRAYVAAEALAKEKKLNIWSSRNFVMPCAFRKNKK